MTSTLFISHSAPDSEIAKALEKAISALLGDHRKEIEITYSSSADCGPHAGEEWREWIEKQILRATTILIVLSRESITRHWPIWEAAACHGVSLLREHEGAEPVLPKIVALTYGISDNDCPDPFKKEQIFSGTNGDDIKQIFMQILEYHNIVDNRVLIEAGVKINDIRDEYLKSINKLLLNSPSLISEASVQDWLSRLDTLIKDKRWSELPDFQDRMNVAYGYSNETMLRQIDLRLHRRLGECHLEQKNFEQAITQLQLARESAPRDVYVLSRLAEAILKHILENHTIEFEDEIGELLNRIENLDSDILYTNPDSAAVAAKYQRLIKKDTQEAIKIYRKSICRNPKSYYLADVLGQTLIGIGEVDQAKETYRSALDILESIPDHNIWSLATKTAAYLVLGDMNSAKLTAGEVSALNPTTNQQESIVNGVVRLCSELDIDKNIQDELIQRIET